MYSSGVSYARTERAALAQLLTEVGPDAPTLCEGWNTQDLAAHLVMRERHVAALGLVVGRISGYTESVRRRVAARPYLELIEALAAGPPWWSPVRPIDRLANTTEMFVHHEDVRRAGPGQWSVRSLPRAHEDALWRMVRPAMRRLLKNIPASSRPVVVLAPTGREQVRVGDGESAPSVHIAGDVGELLLFAFGRQDHARVMVTGPDDAARAVRGANVEG